MVVSPYEVEKLMIKQNNKDAIKANHIISKCLTDQNWTTFAVEGGDHALAIRYWIEKSDEVTEKAHRSVAKTTVYPVAVGMRDIREMIHPSRVAENKAERFHITMDRVLKATYLIPDEVVVGQTFAVSDIKTIEKSLITEVMHVRLEEKIPHAKNIQFVAKKHFTYTLTHNDQSSTLSIAVNKEDEMALLRFESIFNGTTTILNECILIFNMMPKLSVSIIQHKYMGDAEIQTESVQKLASQLQAVAMMPWKLSVCALICFLLLENIVSSVEDHGTVLLVDADFPENFKNMAHVDDYKLLEAPLVPEFIYHQRTGHSRLILRISFFVGHKKYLPMSFIIDTGNPIGFVFSPTAHKLLGHYNRLKGDEVNTEYVNVLEGLHSRQTVGANRILLRTPGSADACK